MTTYAFKKHNRFFLLRWHQQFAPFLIAVTFLAVTSCANKAGEQQVSPQEETNLSDKIRLKELDGASIDLKQYRGKTLFINLWATWCGPCIKEMPSIERAKSLLSNDNVEFLVASNESVEQIESFIKKRNLDLHYVQLQNLEELNVQALPTTFIINAAGKLRFSETGFREWDSAENIELITKIIHENE